MAEGKIKELFYERLPQAIRYSLTQPIVLGAILILSAGEIIIQEFWSKIIIGYAGINLIGFSQRKRFITPKLANPKCHYCEGGSMTTVKLKCEKCGSTSEQKPTKE